MLSRFQFKRLIKRLNFQPQKLSNLVVVGLVFVLGWVLGVRYSQNKFVPFFNVDQGKVEFNLVNASKPESFKNVNFAYFWEVWEILARDYIDPEKLDSAEMVHGAIGGMTAAIGDSYTTYLPPVEDQRAAESLAGAFYGVGIELGYIDGIVGIVSPLNGMPGEKAGLKAGDMIVHFKDEGKGIDEVTDDWTLNDAVNNIRGEKGTSITLTIYRPKEKTEPFEVELTRGEIVIPSVELEYVDHAGKKVAHIKLSRFGDRTNGEWDDSVSEILSKKNELDGVVLDMRNNPGGYFEGSIDVASEFIDNGLVVTQQGRLTSQDFKTRGQARLKSLPLVVVVNRGSASASEIVAGALRDDLGVKLVGENTFGKGTVQDRRSLSNGGGLHVTVAKWILPGGDWINETGIPVDVEVEDNLETEADEVLLKAVEEI